MCGPPEKGSPTAVARGRAGKVIGLAGLIETEDTTDTPQRNVVQFPRRAERVPQARPIRFGNFFSIEVEWPCGAISRIPNAFYSEMGTAALAARSMNYAWRAA